MKPAPFARTFHAACPNGITVVTREQAEPGPGGARQAAGQQPATGPVPALGKHNAAIRAQLRDETVKGTQ